MDAQRGLKIQIFILKTSAKRLPKMHDFPGISVMVNVCMFPKSADPLEGSNGCENVGSDRSPSPTPPLETHFSHQDVGFAWFPLVSVANRFLAKSVKGVANFGPSCQKPEENHHPPTHPAKTAATSQTIPRPLVTTVVHGFARRSRIWPRELHSRNQKSAATSRRVPGALVTTVVHGFARRSRKWTRELRRRKFQKPKKVGFCKFNLFFHDFCKKS